MLGNFSHTLILLVVLFLLVVFLKHTISERAFQCTFCKGNAIALRAPLARFQCLFLVKAYSRRVYRSLSSLLLAKGHALCSLSASVAESFTFLGRACAAERMSCPYDTLLHTMEPPGRGSCCQSRGSKIISRHFLCMMKEFPHFRGSNGCYERTALASLGSKCQEILPSP